MMLQKYKYNVNGENAKFEYLLINERWYKMKKKEAEVLALKKVDVIVEYIMQILEDTSKVSGMMNFIVIFLQFL